MTTEYTPKPRIRVKKKKKQKKQTFWSSIGQPRPPHIYDDDDWHGWRDYYSYGQEEVLANATKALTQTEETSNVAH